MARNYLQSLLVVVCFTIFVGSAYGELCVKFEKPENDNCDRKFCPLERIVNGKPNKCTAAKFQYKCGVFYKNLPGRVDPQGNFESLTFIGALPDALNKAKIQNSAEIRETFGDLKKKQFIIKGVCESGPTNSSRLANARCYTAMLKASNIKFDECTKTVINEDGSETIGDVLCDTIDQKYAGGYFGIGASAPDSIDNIEIAFQYSHCLEPWKQVANNIADPDTGKILSSTPLQAPEKLCCQRDGSGKLRFRRCDGTSFNSVCNGK